MMESIFFSAFVLIITGIGLHYIVIPPVEKSIALQVLGVLGEEEDKHPRIYAHRGGGHDAPENTLAAFRKAKDNGATGVEFDISLTKDGIAVLLHDDTVDRTTNGSGSIGDMTFHEVRELDASKHHPQSSLYEGEKIPTLEEGVQECIKLNLRMIFDVKEYDEKALAAVLDIFEKYPELYKVAVVASFYPNFIYQLRSANPKIVCALTWRPNFISYDDIVNGQPRFRIPWKMNLGKVGDYFLDWSIHSWLWYVTGVSAVLIHKDCISQIVQSSWMKPNLFGLCSETLEYSNYQTLGKDFMR
ncbi:glycerophosphodiester phosphodiesterase 1-like isoform X3 [Limulus polyphemus]|uniref:Glycerophosphodiester phosphodiesterase 1-like isoform X3 n=1 Tax=Limulus polyphemus TaxID=6850 RepID=A0ABM1RZN9_LIMPO|nr:glycerophosphodiester phosphodiesterase 1-like isoform X3 [Limulus polyphemus]